MQKEKAARRNRPESRRDGHGLPKTSCLPSLPGSQAQHENGSTGQSPKTHHQGGGMSGANQVGRLGKTENGDKEKQQMFQAL